MSYRPHLRFTADAKFVWTDLFDYVQPSFSFGDFAIDFTRRILLCPPAVNHSRLRVRNGLFPAGLLAVSTPTSAARDNTINAETRRAVTGLRRRLRAGDVSHADWEVSYNHGGTKNKFLNNNTLLPGNFEAATRRRGRSRRSARSSAARTSRRFNHRATSIRRSRAELMRAVQSVRSTEQRGGPGLREL